MPISSADREIIEKFRSDLEGRLAADPRFRAAMREDRDDGSYLASRFLVGERLWIELAVRPLIPQVRAGIVSDDRWVSEDLEQVIEDSGDEMDEFVEMGFEEAGLTWPTPTVEHYRDQGKYYHFATALPLTRLAELGEAATIDRVQRMLSGYYLAFRPAIEKKASA